MRKKILFIIILVSICINANAQQDAQFTQYMYNMSIINPAYATSNLEVINTGAIHRSQWVNSEGAPRSTSVFAHIPLKDNIEVGISFINDNVGDGTINENIITADFAYILKLNETLKLSLGVKAGVNLLNTDPNGKRLPDGTIVGLDSNDSAFNNINQSFLNTGAGAFLYTDKYYLGLSVPNFLPNKYLKDSNGFKAVGVDEIHFFLTGGYVFDINDNIKLKPATMLKAVQGAPLSVDLTTNVLINNRFEAGIAYRFDDSVAALAGFRITPTLKIGYAYDYTLSNLGDYNSGSHEIMILFDLGKINLIRGYEKSPRFF
jgi:type IX secretion system PorP/SprF family membrane protein